MGRMTNLVLASVAEFVGYGTGTVHIEPPVSGTESSVVARNALRSIAERVDSCVMYHEAEDASRHPGI